ncbi:MAG: trypsin-like peptidase domain-containing protein [Gemmatimonadales bacterium]
MRARALAMLVLALPAPLRAQRTDPIGGERRTVIGRAAARVAPSVVSVNVVRRQRTVPRDVFEQMLVPRGYEQRVEGLGTGFLVSSDGLVITNQHVTAGAESLIVTLRDGRDFQARLLGEDDRTDIAVVKIDTSGLPVAPIGRSRALQIGDWLVAIGNPYGFLLGNTEPTVTAGVVSALNRDILPSDNQAGLYVDMIQTDAAINPGNSGGPLINADGEVVGVNAFILTQSGGFVGLGFAIPIERAMRVARDLAEFGHVRRGWVGVDIKEPQAQSSSWRHQSGLLVRRLAPGGPGERAGLKPDDMIERIDGQPVRNFLSWEKAQLDLASGDNLTLTVRREGGQETVTMAAVDPPSASAERVNLRDLSLITVTPAIQVERQLAAGRGALVVTAGPTWQNAFGIQAGDVIVRINNYVISQAEEVSRIVQYLSGRTTLTLWFVRGNQVMAGQAWGTP